MGWLKKCFSWLFSLIVDFWENLKSAIVDFWNVLVDTLYGWVEGLWDLAAWAVDGIVYYFWAVIDYCLEMAWGFGYFLYDLFLGEEGFVWYIFDFVIWVGELFLGFLPDLSEYVTQYRGAFEYTLGIVGRLNSFYPVTESLALFAAFFTFVILYLRIKFLLKLTPEVG